MDYPAPVSWRRNIVLGMWFVDFRHNITNFNVILGNINDGKFMVFIINILCIKNIGKKSTQFESYWDQIFVLQLSCPAQLRWYNKWYSAHKPNSLFIFFHISELISISNFTPFGFDVETLFAISNFLPIFLRFLKLINLHKRSPSWSTLMWRLFPISGILAGPGIFSISFTSRARRLLYT